MVLVAIPQQGLAAGLDYSVIIILLGLLARVLSVKLGGPDAATARLFGSLGTKTGVVSSSETVCLRSRYKSATSYHHFRAPLQGQVARLLSAKHADVVFPPMFPGVT